MSHMGHEPTGGPRGVESSKADKAYIPQAAFFFVSGCQSGNKHVQCKQQINCPILASHGWLNDLGSDRIITAAAAQRVCRE
jgi:hypothetical protein